MAILSVSGVSATFSSGVGGVRPPVPYVSPSAGSTEAVTAQLFDNTLTPVMPVDFYSLTATLYYNAVGSWSMIVPYSEDLWDAAMSGDFIIEVDWRGLFQFGGKCEQPGFTDSIPGSSSPAGAPVAGPFMTLNGADYLALIANRIAYPNPTAIWTSQALANSDSVAGVILETAIKYYVYRNIGQGAISSRRMPYLDVAADQARGGTVSYTVKFATGVNLNLLEVIRSLISSGAGTTGMGISVERNGKRLTFDVYVPRDLTGSAWFSKDLGNLTSDQFYLTDPTCTNSLAMGQSVAVEKVAVSRTIWNVVEVYADQTAETDVNNLNSSAQLALAQGGYGPLLNVTVIDTPFLTFGRDYGLGDIVTIEVTPGNSYSDIISSVDLSVNPGQDPTYIVTPKTGNSSIATDTDSSIIGALSARIRALERKISGS